MRCNTCIHHLQLLCNYKRKYWRRIIKHNRCSKLSFFGQLNFTEVQPFKKIFIALCDQKTTDSLVYRQNFFVGLIEQCNLNGYRSFGKQRRPVIDNFRSRERTFLVDAVLPWFSRPVDLVCWETKWQRSFLANDYSRCCEKAQVILSVGFALHLPTAPINFCLLRPN